MAPNQGKNNDRAVGHRTEHRLMLRSVKGVSFDADGTLWDFDATMRAALEQAIGFLAERDERLAGLTADELVEVRQEIAQRPHPRGRSMEDLRLIAFEEALRRRGSTDGELVQEVTSFYLTERFANPVLYDDARRALDLLGTRFALALVSNGNSDPERCGLPGVFRTTVFADRLGVAKPDPRIYDHLLQEMGLAAHEVVHVGDSLRNDVEAAGLAGMRTVWVNRAGASLPANLPAPDATIRTLLDLPTVLEKGT